MVVSNKELINSFLDYLRTNRRVGCNTTDNYGRDIRKLAEWFNQPLVKIRREDLLLYLTNLKQGPRSKRRYIQTFRCFFRFLLDEEKIAHDPTLALPVPRRHDALPKYATQADVDMMLTSLGNSHIHIRDRAIVLLLFGSGLRASELVNLRLDSIDLKAGIVKIWNGKGGKDAVLPLSSSAIEAIGRYLAEVRPVHAALQNHESPFLFLPSHGFNMGSTPIERMTRQMLCYRINRISEDALGRRVYPHQLRHGFCTVLVENGLDILDVQALMRHAFIDTTQGYVHINLKYLKEKYDASHPRAYSKLRNSGLSRTLPHAVSQ